jgi:RNA polymerase sigma factor (TIGR02999 family)
MSDLEAEAFAAPGEITRLLDAHREGDREAFGILLPLVYDDLRRLARRQLGRGRPDTVLDTTGLVHELYLKLAGPHGFDSVNRGHFFHLAARAMRQVVIGYARKRAAAKRGAGRVETTLDEGHLAIAEDAVHLLAVDDALARLGERDPRLVQVVECRFFAGLSEAETAEALGTSLRTAQRDWNRARAWLREELTS